MQNPLSIEWKESLNISSSLRKPLLSRSYSALRGLLTSALLFSFVFFVNSVFATGTPKQIGKDLYACIADNDATANSTFLVGNAGILVVDSGLNEIEAGKCMAEIRSVSRRPIRYVINTHYHLDHQGGNKIFKPEASIISTGWTRTRTMEMRKDSPPRLPITVVPADVTFESALTIHLEPYTVEVISGAPGHTLGDAYVYFPEQKAIATGDLFMGHSCPAMDEGSVSHWIATLNVFLATPSEVFVPGHFEVGDRKDLTFFRDYLSDLEAQVVALSAQGMTLEQVKLKIKPGRFAGLRQFPQYEATFADNAESIYLQLRSTNP
jgi:cyclase